MAATRKATIKAIDLAIGDIVEMNNYKHEVVNTPQRGFDPVTLGHSNPKEYVLVNMRYAKPRNSASHFTFVFSKAETCTILVETQEAVA